MIIGFATSWAQPDSLVNDTPRVSLVTCHAGSVMYELCGHTAIRIQMGNEDIAVNYGLFEFQADNFALKFVKGETDYRVGAYPFDVFMQHYLSENRRVVEQQLNLTHEQAQRIVALLVENLRPENCVYRYNYVKNNCATKPIDIIEKGIGGIINFNEPQIPDAREWTYRDEMRHFHKNYTWYQFGIDLALGNGIDYTLDTREKMFAPMALESMIREATVTDVRGNTKSIVAKETVLNEGIDAQLPPTPFLASPIFVFSLLLLVVIAVSVRDVRRKRVSRWLDAVLFGLFALASLLVTFLIFVSVHEATSPNYLFLWLNPLSLIAAIGIWLKKCNKIVVYYHFANFVALILLTIILLCGVQQGNVAFIPLILSSLIRSVTNIYINRCNARITD